VVQVLSRPSATAGAGAGSSAGPGAGAGTEVAAAHSSRWLERRLTLIWGLLFFNGMTWLAARTLVPIPQALGQLLTMGALVVALILALLLNPKLVVRPQFILVLYSALACVALAATVKNGAGFGPMARSIRLFVFVGVLWLLTPWWGRRDMLLARCHLRVMIVVLGTVVLGLIVAPGTALGSYGRLTGVLWPIWATSVAHYAAVGVGIAGVLWMSGNMPRRAALWLSGVGLAIMALSKTRIAVLSLGGGMAFAACSLFFARRRVRRLTTVVLVVGPVLLVALSPLLITWYSRGQSASDLSSLNGRKRVWDLLLAAPRSEFVRWFGHGLSDKGFNGLPIDSTWLAAYQDTGLIGVTLVGLALVFLLLRSSFNGPTAARALAVFLLVYAAIDSYTEVGLADASPYLLDLMACASLLATSPFAARGHPD